MTLDGPAGALAAARTRGARLDDPGVAVREDRVASARPAEGCAARAGVDTGARQTARQPARALRRADGPGARGGDRCRVRRGRPGGRLPPRRCASPPAPHLPARRREGKVVAQGKDIAELWTAHDSLARAAWKNTAPSPAWERNGLRTWDFGDLASVRRRGACRGRGSEAIRRSSIGGLRSISRCSSRRPPPRRPRGPVRGVFSRWPRAASSRPSRRVSRRRSLVRTAPRRRARTTRRSGRRCWRASSTRPSGSGPPRSRARSGLSTRCSPAGCRASTRRISPSPRRSRAPSPSSTPRSPRCGAQRSTPAPRLPSPRSGPSSRSSSRPRSLPGCRSRGSSTSRATCVRRKRGSAARSPTRGRTPRSSSRSSPYGLRFSPSRRRRAIRDAVDALRWSFEELRVAVFAPELRTPVPVSVEKLKGALAELR